MARAKRKPFKIVSASQTAHLYPLLQKIAFSANLCLTTGRLFDIIEHVPAVRRRTNLSDHGPVAQLVRAPLVRMRSPVRIWIAAPKANTSKSQDLEVFFVYPFSRTAKIPPHSCAAVFFILPHRGYFLRPADTRSRSAVPSAALSSPAAQRRSGPANNPRCTADCRCSGCFLPGCRHPM